MKTRVQFLIHKDDMPEVFAYFPDEIWDNDGNRTSYDHVGQHGGCSPIYAEECAKATQSEYEVLQHELEILN
jgi:hypothetical protein